PYNRSYPAITITAIQVTTDSTPKVLVAWSRKLSGGSTYSAGYTKGSTTTVPASLKVAGSYLIRVESQLSYTPVVAWSTSQKQTLGLMAAFDSLPMGDTYYLRPRMSDTIPCSDC
ncbi:MAG: pilus assembly protein, partial [Parafilimonas terrae]|nr:pilus assembly protein [Parafilimonas terrae]